MAGIPAAAAPGPGSDPGFGLDERASLALCVADPSSFDSGSVLEFLVRVDAELSRFAAARVRLLAELSARDTSQDRWVAEEVGAALRLSPTRAMSEVKSAVQLHGSLPRTFAQLAAGQVTAGQARLVAEASYRLPPDPSAMAAFDQQAAARCGEMSEPQTRQFLRRQVLRADPAGAERRHQLAASDRHVRLVEAEDGMAVLSALLPAAEATACMQRLDAAARSGRQARRATTGAPTDVRTLDQLRADVFVESLLGRGTGEGAGAVSSGDPGLGASINVIVTAATLLGQDEEPGWLDRYGPITADTARRLAHDPTGTWRRLVTDPATGYPVDVGTWRYHPPAAVRRQVELRDGGCRFPYCTQPASVCDLDHAVPWPRGSTTTENLHALSRRHHRAKTLAGWRVALDPETGEAMWTSPIGRTTRTRPLPRWTMPDDDPARIDDGAHGPDDARQPRGPDGAGADGAERPDP